MPAGMAPSDARAARMNDAGAGTPGGGAVSDMAARGANGTRDKQGTGRGEHDSACARLAPGKRAGASASRTRAPAERRGAVSRAGDGRLGWLDATHASPQESD